ncbi:MAG: DUF4388 domain-containing protein [Thermodesulfobacteriota bacterium]
MKGKIADFSIPDIFQLISSQGKSGSLTISCSDRSTVFFFSEGRIVDVQPLHGREERSLLGMMLRDAGYLTDGELKRVLDARGKGGGKKIGEILIDRGMVPREIVSRYLVLQIKECLFDVLTYREGEYRFETFAIQPLPWGGEPIRPDILMMEGMQFLDEYPIYRQSFPPGQFRVTRRKGERVDPYSFTEPERVLWKALEFSEVPERVFRKACMTGFEGIKALSALRERGLLEIASAEPAETDVAHRLREELLLIRRLAWGKAALWIGAGFVVAMWIRGTLLSKSAADLFTGWASFF